MRSKGLEPLEPFPGVTKRWRCRCTRCGAEVSPTLKSVRLAVTGCRTCGLERSAAARRTSHDDAVAELQAVDLEPLEPYPGTATRKWRCRCLRCGDEVSPDLKHIRRGQRGCARFAGNLVIPDEASEVMRAAGAEPLVAYPGSHQPWLCRCLTCGREVTPSYNSVASRGQGVCVWCSRRVVEPSEAEATMWGAGLEPLAPYPGSKAPWLCACLRCRRKVSPSVSSVRSGKGCAYCSGNRVDPGEAVALMRASGLDPLEPYPGATSAWHCRCRECHRELTSTYQSVSSGARCAFCSRVRVDPLDALAVMEAAGLEPLEPYPGALVTWHCRCTGCGRDVHPRYGNVVKGQGGCVYCAAGRRFDPGAPAWLYLLAHQEFRAWQVGITGRLEKRLAAHARAGWHLVELYVFDRGISAMRAEAEVIAAWRRQGFPDAVPRAAMPQGGHTETVAWVNLPELTLRPIAEANDGRPELLTCGPGATITPWRSGRVDPGGP